MFGNFCVCTIHGLSSTFNNNKLILPCRVLSYLALAIFSHLCCQMLPTCLGVVEAFLDVCFWHVICIFYWISFHIPGDWIGCNCIDTQCFVLVGFPHCCSVLARWDMSMYACIQLFVQRFSFHMWAVQCICLTFFLVCVK